MLLNVYLVLSAFLLGFVAFTWSSKYWPNLFIKLAFIGTTLFGCVLIAKLVVHV